MQLAPSPCLRLVRLAAVLQYNRSQWDGRALWKWVGQGAHGLCD